MSLLQSKGPDNALDRATRTEERVSELEAALDERDATIARQQRLIHDLAASLKEAVEQFGYCKNAASEQYIENRAEEVLAEVEAMG